MAWGNHEGISEREALIAASASVLTVALLTATSPTRTDLDRLSRDLLADAQRPDLGYSKVRPPAAKSRKSRRGAAKLEVVH